MGVIPSHDPLTAPIPAEVPLPNAPLLRVIAQIRFPQVLSIEKREFVAPFQEALRSQYPVLRNELSQAVMFGPQGASPAAPQTIWRFADVESNWRVSLAPDFAAIETTAYESRKDFLKRFEAVVHALGEHVSPRVLDRVGVRYIDRVTGDAFDAIENLVGPEVLGVAATALGAHAVHAISESVFAISQTGAQLLARWGLLPKGATVDPAAIEPLDQPSWILDLDMYRSGQREYDAAAVVQEANGFAERIYAVFRWAVTDNFLRRYGGQV